MFPPLEAFDHVQPLVRISPGESLPRLLASPIVHTCFAGSFRNKNRDFGRGVGASRSVSLPMSDKKEEKKEDKKDEKKPEEVAHGDLEGWLQKKGLLHLTDQALRGL